MIILVLSVLANSCVLLAYGALALRNEPARGTLPESSQYSKVDGRVFYNSWDSTGKLNQERLSDADFEKFQVIVLKNGVLLGSDGVHLYLGGKELFGVDSRTFEGISFLERDSTGFVGESSEHLYKDSKHVYLENEGVLQVVERADPSSFQRITGYWSKDQSNYFLRLRLVDFVDIGSFQILSGPWAKDRKGIYLADKFLPLIDSLTFVPIEESYLYGLGKDKNSVYWAGKVIPDADPGSFRMIYADRAVDKNYYFSFFPFSKRELTPQEKMKYKL